MVLPTPPTLEAPASPDPTRTAARTAAPTPTPALPLAAAAAAAACFIGMDATVKTLAPRFDALQLTFLRFAAGSLFALPLWLWFRPALPGRAQWRWHLLRCALLLASLLSYFHALTLLPLVQTVAVGYLAPILISLLAMLVLRERPSRWIWAALALGLAGVGVSLWPELRGSALPGSADRVQGLLAVTCSAFTYSGVVVLARHQAQRDALWSILLVQNLLPTAVLLLPMAWRWPALQAADAGPVLLIGLLATCGLLGVTWAFSRLEASRAAPIEYTGFVWAALLGFVLFGELPTAYSATSAALIIGGCLLLLRK